MRRFFQHLFFGDKELKELRNQLKTKRKSIEDSLPLLDFMTESEDNKIVLSLNSITTEWSEFMPGMDLRSVELLGYSSGTLIECVVHKPLLMKKHCHKEAEAVFMLEGRMRDEMTGEEIGIGESMYFKPEQVHQPNYLEKSRCKLLWFPPLARVVKKPWPGDPGQVEISENNSTQEKGQVLGQSSGSE